MFKLPESTDKAPILHEFLVTDSEAITEGECLSFSAGRLTKTAAGAAVACIAMHSVTAGTDKTCKVVIVLPSQIWEADYTGTADAGFIVGCATADIDSTGLLLNAADITGGAWAIISKNTTTKKCRVICHNRVLS